MGISNFKAQMTAGGARANQFEVFLQFPAQLGLGGTAAASSRFMCEAASLPGQTIGITPIMYRGREVKLAGERRFENWAVTVINDGTFAIHSEIELWMNAINNIKENTGVVDPLSYTADMVVSQLDRNDKELKVYKIVNAWPVSISPIQLSFADNDTIERFQVEFALDWFESYSSTGAVIAG